MTVARTLAVALLTSVLAAPSVAAATSTTPLPVATALSLPTPNAGIYEGYLPAMACWSPGNCVAGGTFNDGKNNQQGVVLNESNGVWQTGIQISPPNGPVARSQGVSIYDAACGGPSSCSVTGTYLDSFGSQHTMVINEVNSAWQHAQELRLPTDAPSSGLQSQPHSISCVSVGNCVVVGTYNTTTNFVTMGFAANEVNGVWKNATAVVLPTNQNANPQVTFNQVSCWAVGGCEAVGSYVDTFGVTHAFVLTSTRGVWHSAQLVPLPSNTSAYSGASFNEVTCYATATCTIIGTYTSSTGAQLPMAATMIKGVWARAVSIALPSDAAANPATFLWGYKGIACGSAGNCTFGGDYRTKATSAQQPSLQQGFVVNQIRGVWQSATTLPLPARAAQAGTNGGVIAVSCVAVGSCTAAAAYLNNVGAYNTMVISETGFTWGPPQPISLPNGASTVGTGGGIYGLRCFATGGCQVVGSYLATSTTYQGFAVRW